MSTSTLPMAPVATPEPHAITAHGHTRLDPYFWMRLSEAQREAESPDAHTTRVIDHLKAENAYSDALLAPVKHLRETLYQEMKGRIKETDMSVPYRENGYWYSFRYEAGQEYPVHMRMPVVPGEDDIPPRSALWISSTRTCWRRDTTISIWATTRSHRPTRSWPIASIP